MVIHVSLICCSSRPMVRPGRWILEDKALMILVQTFSSIMWEIPEGLTDIVTKHKCWFHRLMLKITDVFSFYLGFNLQHEMSSTNGSFFFNDTSTKIQHFQTRNVITCLSFTWDSRSLIISSRDLSDNHSREKLYFHSRC